VTHAELSLDIPAAAWGRLAAVYRTLEWVSHSSDRSQIAPFVGVNCGRLMDEALPLIALGDERQAELLRARALLAGLDARPDPEREGVVNTLRGIFESIIPLSQLGASIPMLQKKGELITPESGKRSKKPSRRKDRSRRSAEAPETPVEPDAEEPTPEAVEVSEVVPDADPTGAETDGGEDSEDTGRDSVESAERRSRRASSERRSRPEKVEPPREPPPPPKLLLGHPEGTGRGITVLKSVDEDAAAALGEIGIETIEALLLHPPATHQRPPSSPILTEMPDGVVMVRAQVVSRCLRLSPAGRRWELILAAATGERLTCRWIMAAPRGWSTWQVGDQIGLTGAVEPTDEGGPVMYEGEPVGVNGRGSGLMPMYGLPGLDDAQLRDIISEALEETIGKLIDPMPGYILERYRLLTLDEALRDAHFPANASCRGRLRLAFEELLLLQLGIVWRAGRGQDERGFSHTPLHTGIAQLGSQHNLFLDNGQELAFSDIRRDLVRPTPMSRLLQGDVGTGKNLVALMAAVMVAESRIQVAMVGPDPLSVERRYLFAENLLRSVGVTPLLISDTLNHAQADAIRRGEAHVIFGTQRLLSNDIHWRRLGLVVVEERGTFGSVSLDSLPQRKGPCPDLLVTTPVPIPSSLAFTVFGEFDVSLIPATRQLRSSGRIFAASERTEAYEALREQLDAGRQAFLVFPVRGGRDLLGTEDALRMAKALQADVLPGARIGIYCSAMTRDERFRVFDDFQHRRIDALVCTTYIEEAPPVDNATVMMIEYADLHDMDRLHRLRGHVARGPRSGNTIYMLSENPSEDARARIETVVRELDGFRLAELDLQVRGSEALLGDRADEVPTFCWADPPRDREQLLRARAEAFKLVRENPELTRWPELISAIRSRWGEWFGDSLPDSAGGAQRQGSSARRRRRRRRRRK
jgi:ATP-dependent DNA helicase RecG